MNIISNRNKKKKILIETTRKCHRAIIGQTAESHSQAVMRATCPFARENSSRIHILDHGRNIHTYVSSEFSLVRTARQRNKVARVISLELRLVELFALPRGNPFRGRMEMSPSRLRRPSRNTE